MDLKCHGGGGKVIVNTDKREMVKKMGGNFVVIQRESIIQNK